ncbi:MAG: hypothetical protein Q9M20_06075 [Mariprofundaceae bacterium]|nr:hypothetical protein [Mariprofundaceae bacterium]
MYTKPIPLIIHDLQDSQMFALAQAAGRANMVLQALASSEQSWLENSRYFSSYKILPSLGDVIESVYALSLKKSGVSGVWLPCVDDVAMFTAAFQDFLKSRGMLSLVAKVESIEHADLSHLQDFQGFLNIPKTRWLSHAELQGDAVKLSYPLILKSSRGNFQRFNDAKKLLTHLDAAEHVSAFSQRIQQYILGDVTNMATAMLLFDKNSQPVRGFTGRRLRVAQTKYGDFGETTAAQAEWIPELYEGAVELLKYLNWQGFAEVECKQATDGTWFVLEINPRLSGWTCLAEADGAGFLQAYYAMCAHDMPLKETCLQRSKAKYIRMLAAGFHKPDWFINQFVKNKRHSKLYWLIKDLYQLWRYKMTLSAGAWDFLDRQACKDLCINNIRKYFFRGS